MGLVGGRAWRALRAASLRHGREGGEELAVALRELAEARLELARREAFARRVRAR